jgi:hypothetical protein
LKKKEKNKNKKKKRKIKRKKEKVRKKKEENTVDYCCNPQCFVWGNSDSPIPFRICCNIYS